MTQKQIVLEHLQRFGSLTTMEAFEQLGLTRVGARVCDLRKEGWHIVTIPEESVNKYGKNVRYARYILRRKST